MVLTMRKYLLATFALTAIAPFAPYIANAQQRPQQVAQAKSTSDQREEVGITVYNQNFGLVREVRTIDLAAGRTALEFRDVSEQIES